jgi:type I restriction enzyme S subunit
VSLQTFFHNFALLADTPNGVNKLRELILQLAIRGQLDTQDNDDELSVDLARKIQRYQATLIKSKQIRNSKPLPAIQPSEILFEIPQSWQWIRLGEIGDWGAGATPDRKSPKYYGGNFRWFKSGELNDGYIRESEETITDLALKECSLRLNQPGDVLIAMYGATIGKLAILETEATTNQAVCACTCFNGFYNQFLFVLLRAYKSHFTGRGAGGAQPNISREKIIHTVAPLPPFEEQRRIVAKVDELMRLCDELEARQQARRASRLRLNNVTLAPLNRAASLAPKEFEQASERLGINFAALYDSAETVGRLRSTILQLAVQGKLVGQDPRDEPASKLIASVKKEKARLLGERAIKRDKPSFPFKGSDIPYCLPDGWEWERIANLITLKSGSTLAPDMELSDGQIPYLKVGDMNLAGNEKVITTSSRYVQRSHAIIKDIIPANSIIFPKRGGAIATNKKRLVRSEIVIDSNTMAMICHRPMPLEYLHLWLMTVDLWQLNSGTSVPQINNKDIEPLLMQVPPLAEQKRIVAKVNQLMALCDELETKLRQTEADSERLMKAAVRDLLASITNEQSSIGQEKSRSELALALSST